jgi:hypothetical protein
MTDLTYTAFSSCIESLIISNRLNNFSVLQVLCPVIAVSSFNRSNRVGVSHPPDLRMETDPVSEALDFLGLFAIQINGQNSKIAVILSVWLLFI